ncbi:hypothetical protein TcCL_NonESM02366 [Trypanosoma cruzi]|uniref:Uncharacterized protein n=2 Tax=Trypanosoma cruzi TaxID=5693 RepID=Q4E307_TRYCC|nr:hypothetical protein, conserved [Trypanosoma cruzi]EAN99169.1 hypothetical protein, conserved [Trypanosoma cruzi]RNC47765.1 hypothetical protein TcCL_NonESM02366 [Trypanosoma cruzi]|eukprot:XP_821020.1 hypothetical protein [Trypanosoma cruzi strain CL Brener]
MEEGESCGSLLPQMPSLLHGFKLLRATLWYICFPEEVTVYIDPIIRFIFTVYHLPPIALVLALTHSGLERIVWVLIVPVAQQMEKQPYDSSCMTTFMLGMYHIFLLILPYSTLGVAVATLGHKVLHCFLETMVDAHSTHQGKDYPLFAARLRFIMQDRQRYYVFLVVLFLLVSVALSGLHTDLLVAWPAREPWVVTGAWCIIALQVSFVWGSAISHPELPPHPFIWRRIVGIGDGEFARFFCGTWWKSYIHYMRYIAIEMVALIAFVALFFRGPLYVLSSSVELVMYLNMPHLVGHTVVSISVSIINIQCSLKWLRRHSDAVLPVIFIASPFQLLLFRAMFYFRHHRMTVLLLIGVNVLFIQRVIDLVREFDVTEAGSVYWKYVDKDEPIPPYLSVILENAYETKSSHIDVASLDYLIDIKAMKIHRDGEEVDLERKQITEYGNAHSFIWDGRFYAYTVPRMISVQSSRHFGGKHFRRVYVLLRMITSCCLMAFTALVMGLLFQAAFPQLHPLPVRVSVSADGNALTVDHIVLRMHLLSGQADVTPTLPIASSAMGSASAAFKWHNATSLGEDWYSSLCARTFHDISIWEISLLALASYLSNDDEVKEMLDFMSMHMGSDWVVRERHGTDCISIDSSTQPTGWDGYYDFYSAKHDMSIIAVSGTDMTSFRDFLIDVNLFFEVVLYHLLSNIIPGAVILPSELIADLIRLASLPAAKNRESETWETLVSSRNTNLRVCENNNYRRDYFADVYNHLAFVGSRPNPPKHVLLTGHSLGGAVASVIGSRMGIHAVGFSAPGISLSRKKFGIDLESIHKFVTRVISSHDIFPMIGGSGGEEHHVECLAKTRELCHAMEFLVGTLWRSCGSIRARYPSIHSVV